MSSCPTQPRGRPRGSGIDDTPVLTKVAKWMLDEPGLRPTTAMKREVRGISDSHLRRLQVKWRDVGEQLLQEAEHVKAQRQASPGNGPPVAQTVAQLELAGLIRTNSTDAFLDGIAKGLSVYEIVMRDMGAHLTPLLSAFAVASQNLGEQGRSHFPASASHLDPETLRRFKHNLRMP